jgi:hypothetical protein
MVDDPVGNATLWVRVHIEDILIPNLQEHDQNYHLTFVLFFVPILESFEKGNELSG